MTKNHASIALVVAAVLAVVAAINASTVCHSFRSAGALEMALEAALRCAFWLAVSSILLLASVSIQISARRAAERRLHASNDLSGVH